MTVFSKTDVSRASPANFSNSDASKTSKNLYRCSSAVATMRVPPPPPLPMGEGRFHPQLFGRIKIRCEHSSRQRKHKTRLRPFKLQSAQADLRNCCRGF